MYYDYYVDIYRITFTGRVWEEVGTHHHNWMIIKFLSASLFIDLIYVYAQVRVPSTTKAELNTLKYIHFVRIRSNLYRNFYNFSDFKVGANFCN